MAVTSIQKNNAGFTLIETVVVLGIFLVIMLGMLSLYDHYHEVYNAQEGIARAAGSAGAAANEIQNAALQADQIAASHVFSGTTYTTGANTLVLEIPSVDSSGNLVASKWDYAVFYISGKRLYKIFKADAASSRLSASKQLSESVSAINFTYNNADVTQATKVDTDIQMQVVNGHQAVPYHLYQTIYLRNK